MGIVTTFPSVGVCHLVGQRFFVIFFGVFGIWEDKRLDWVWLSTQRFSIRGAGFQALQRSSFLLLLSGKDRRWYGYARHDIGGRALNNVECIKVARFVFRECN